MPHRKRVQEGVGDYRYDVKRTNNPPVEVIDEAGYVGQMPLIRFPENTYMRISLDDLLIYAVKSVLETGEECTFERLVYECFTLFPKRFGFYRYPHWPDAATIVRSLRRCRTDKGWLVGSVKEGFHLTPKGEEAFNRVEWKLKVGKIKAKPRDVRARERYEVAVRQIRRSAAFLRFLRRPQNFTITETEFRSLLNCTLESPIRILRQNLHHYKYVAQKYNASDVQCFLEACEQQMESLLKKKRQ